MPFNSDWINILSSGKWLLASANFDEDDFEIGEV